MQNSRILRDKPEARAAAKFAAWLPHIFRSRFDFNLHPVHAETGQFDLRFTFDHDTRKRSLFVNVKPRWLRSYASPIAKFSDTLRRQHSEGIPLLAVPALSTRAREELREIGVNYADLTGALFIREPGIYIDVDSATAAGDSETESQEKIGAASSTATLNPFTDAASIVLRFLLNEPDRTWQIQELANAGGMSPGWVATVARALELRGYAMRSQHGSGRDSDLRIADPVAALQDWSAAYSWRANSVVSYNVPFEYAEIIPRLPALLDRVEPAVADDQPGVAMTLLSAADLYAAHVQHEQVHVYAGAQAFASLDDRVRQLFHGERVEQGGNFHVLQPYYRRSVFVHARVMKGVSVVSPVQLYLDLMQYPVRGEEAASILVRAVLGPTWKLSPDQVRELTA